jgi:hypothetical protein
VIQSKPSTWGKPVIKSMLKLPIGVDFERGKREQRGKVV